MVRGVYIQRSPSERMTVEAALKRYLAEVSPTKRPSSMSFVLITGTLAVISNELDWLTHASVRVEPQAMSERASWGEIYASLHTAHPQWQFSYIAEPIDPWFSVLTYAQTAQGQRRLVDFDPYKAEVRGDRHWMSFQRFFVTSTAIRQNTASGADRVSARSCGH